MRTDRQQNTILFTYNKIINKPLHDMSCVVKPVGTGNH